MRLPLRLQAVILMVVLVWPATIFAQGIAPAPPPQPQGSTQTQTVAPTAPQPAGPAIRSFSPQQGQQGTTVALTILGTRFSPAVTLNFNPPTGLQVLSLSVISSSRIDAQVKIEATAPVGPRQLSLTFGPAGAPAGMLAAGGGSAQAALPFTVTPAPQQPAPTTVPPSQIGPGAQRAVLPTVLKVTPNQVTAGAQGVELKIEGKYFAPGASVNFSGSGIFSVGAVQFTDSTEIHVKINVLPTAQLGGRDVIVQNPGEAAGTGKGMLNITAAKKAPAKPPKQPPKPKVSQITNETPFLQGKIYLTDPLWGKVNQKGEIIVDKGVPLVDDEIVFKWKEQNPGTADYFELRIFAKDGKTLLVTQKIESTTVKWMGTPVTFVPTYFRPDPKFIAELLAKVPSVESKVQVDIKAKLGQQKGGTKAPPDTGTKLSDGAMQWEVGGFRVFNKSGKKDEMVAKMDAKPEQTVLQVEVSDRWPLGKPNSPNGLACGDTGVTKSKLQVANISDKNIYKNGKKVGEDPNNYAGDLFALTGSLTLGNSPYAAHPGEVKAPAEPGQVFATVAEYQFDNLFVDWGDGAIEPLSLPAPKGVLSYTRGDVMTLPGANDAKRIVHSYGYTGTYHVRVFQIADADLQKIDPASLAQSLDGPTGGPYGKLIAVGMTTTPPPGGPIAIGVKPSGPSLSEVASRAYMLFCAPVTITNRQDTDATGPLHLVSIEVTGFPGHDPTKPASDKMKMKALPPGGAPKAGTTPGKAGSQQMTMQVGKLAAGGDLAQASSCDESLQGKGLLHYYGRGKARITWRLDGVVVGAPQELAGLSSEPRKNLGADKSKWPPPIVSQAEVSSPFLTCKQLGVHKVTAEAEVIPEPAAPELAIAVGGVVGMLGGSGAPAGDKAMAKSVLIGLNKNPLKVGYLSPSPKGGAGAPPVAYLDPKSSVIVGLIAGIEVKGPPTFVESAPRSYLVVESNPTQPCVFVFASNGGDFRITDIQGKITKNGNQYSGEGILQFLLTDGPDSAHPYAVPLSFQNWEVPDGLKVLTGALAVSPALEVMAPGVKGKLASIQGQLQGGAKSDMQTTLDLGLKDQTLRLPGVEKPQEWKGLKAPITSEGDWYLAGQQLPTTLIGWSAFKIQSTDVRVDLSRTQGEGASSLCASGSGVSWTGVHLGSAELLPYTMDLVAAGSLKPTVKDWAIVDSGLCGTVTTGPFSATLGEGSLHFDSIQATAHKGEFHATYKGMKVHVPWLDTDLTGDAKLQSGGGEQAMIAFPLSGTASAKSYGTFVMKPANLKFGREQNVGWAVRSDTHFDFKAEGKPFASFDVSGLFFGMNARAYFEKGVTGNDVSLSGQSTLGETPLDLVAVHLEAPTSGAERLRFAIATLARLSEVMPAANMQVNYAITRSGAEYQGSGPANSPFTVKVQFPSGQPTIDAAINPIYGTGSGTRYSGVVDLGMFGGPPIKAEFLLGYQGGKDYWITRATIELGSAGVAVFPPINLFAIRGGLGHNFALDSFKSTAPITGLTPKIDGSFLFMAGMRVGSADKFTFMLDGDFTVKTSGENPGARMDFHSWILKNTQSGDGDFLGFFQYTPGNFDGEMWGSLAMLNGAVGINVPKGAASMHFGGPWHIYFGKKDGPRIKGFILVAEADSYVMIGSEEGLAIGGKESVYLGAGEDDVGSAFVKGWMDIGMQVTPQPHISGDFSAGCKAGGCLAGECVSMGVTAKVHAEALPVNIKAHACLDMPWPIPDPCINVHL